MKTITRWFCVLSAVLAIALAAGCGGGASSHLATAPATDAPSAALADAQLVDKGEAGKVSAIAPADLAADWTWDLIAGQTLKVGTVHVTNDAANFFVEYQVDPSLPDTWLIHQVHVYIGTAAPPANGAPGQFTYVDDGIDPGVTNYVATIPFSDVFGADEPGKGQIYVATHAVVCTEGEAGQPYGGFSISGGTVTATMWAGQHYNAGSLSVQVVGDNLVVTYNTTGGWQMTKTQLYVGTNPPGNAPGQYPYQTTHNPAVTTYTYSVPLASLGFDQGNGTLYLAAHADSQLVDAGGNVIQSETAWAWPGNGAVEFGQGWGRYFSINLVYDWFGGDPAAGVCETAWGGSNGIKIKGKYQWTLKWNKKWGGYFTTCVMPVPDLTPDWVTYKGFHFGTYSYWNILFLDPVVLPPGSFTQSGNEYWVGWCADKFHSMFSNLNYEAKLYSSYDPNLPAFAQNANWDLINFMINQRRNPTTGGPFVGVNWTTNANKESFQQAVWFFSDGVATADPLAQQLIAYAQANGENFIPCAPGQFYAIVLFPDTSTNNNQVRAQMNIIEVDP